MKKTLPLTEIISELNERLNVLQKNLDKVMAQKLWERPVGMNDKITYLETIANTRQNLFREAQKFYPQLVGKSYGVGSINIEYEEEEND